MANQNQSKQDRPEGGGCPAQPEYSKLLETASAWLFDPSKLGDVHKLEKQNSCLIKSTADAIRFANDALKTAGDPYNVVMDKAQVDKFEAEARGDFGGIGVSFEVPTKHGPDVPPLVVHNTIPGSPARDSQIQPGDVITEVNGKKTAGMPQGEALHLLDGAVGQNMKFMLQRGTEVISKNLTLAEIEVPPIQEKQLKDGITYISVDNFADEQMPEKLQQEMQMRQSANAFIIDLRDNGGGYVEAALAAASMFVKSGTLETEKARIPSAAPGAPQYSEVKHYLSSIAEFDSERKPGQLLPSIHVHSRMPYLAGDKPVVILVNQNTASAAELFTAALKDNNKNVTIVGTQTFGKGIEQEVFKDMPGGSWLEVTNKRYFTPSGQWLGDGANNRYGIKPQVIIDNAAGVFSGGVNDQQLNAAVNYIEKKISGSNR